jgi:replicative DNA helicase
MSAAASSLFGDAAYRQPPMNIQAEQALLGTLLANNRTLAHVVDFLQPQHFADAVHALIYQRIVDRVTNGELADAVTLRGDFERSGQLDQVGGLTYLAQLLSAMVGVLSVPAYGRAIHDAWLRRELAHIGQQVVELAHGADPSQDATAQVISAQKALADLTGRGARDDRLMSLGEAVSAALRQAVEAYRTGVTGAVLTHMLTLDKALGGLWPGDFDLLAGIPGSGKTALAVQIAYTIGKRKFDAAIAAGATPQEASKLPGVAVFSLEMRAEELGARIAAYRASVGVERLRSGQFDMIEAERLAAAEREAMWLPVRIHDCRQTSVRLLGAKARLHFHRQPEELAIVDHLLVAESDPGPRARSAGSDVASVAKAARDYKTLAGDLGLPFLVLTHASRASGDRPDHGRPTLRDVKWAGEGDADALVFVHRPIMHMTQSPPARTGRQSEEQFMRAVNLWHEQRDAARDLAEIVVAKRRMGPTGVWRMRFDGPTTSFGEIDGVSAVDAV